MKPFKLYIQTYKGHKDAGLMKIQSCPLIVQELVHLVLEQGRNKESELSLYNTLWVDNLNQIPEKFYKTSVKGKRVTLKAKTEFSFGLRALSGRDKDIEDIKEAIKKKKDEPEPE